MYTDKEKSYEKHRLRMFWTHRWQYKRVELWEEILEEICTQKSKEARNLRNSYVKDLSNTYKPLWKDALIKMTFDRRLSLEEATNLLEMLFSKDKESRSLALMVIQRRKPNIFLKK